MDLNTCYSPSKLNRYVAIPLDVGSRVKGPQTAQDAWTCEVCSTTEGNTHGWDRCMVCNRPKGTWLCECGHLNPKTATECETCGRNKK